MVPSKTMVEWSCQINVTMMVLLYLIQLTCSGNTCPRDLLNEAFSCLRNLTHGSNQSSLVSAIDADLMKKNCGTGAFDDSVQCLRRLYQRCDDPEAQEWLQKLARPTRWQSGFDRFCQHVNLYTNQKHCIQEQNAQVESCVRENKEEFVNSEKYVIQTKDGYSVDEITIKNTCSMFYWTYRCLNGPLRNSCGREVGAVVSDFHGGITPPMCNNYVSSGRTTNHSSKTIVIVLTVIAFLISLLR